MGYNVCTCSSKRDQCAQLSEEVTLYKETLAVKDQVVVDLTHKVYIIYNNYTYFLFLF